MDQELKTASRQLGDAAAYATGRRCMCTYQITALLCVKSHHGCHLENVTSYWKYDSINRCVLIFLKNIPAKFHPDPI